MLTTTLRAVGGSVMFAIPKAILKSLQLRPNDSVGVSLADGKLIVDPRPGRRYALAELLAECDPNAERTTEDHAWLSDAPVGGEII